MYNVLIEFGTSMKLLRIINMILNEAYNKVLRNRILSDLS